MYGPHVNTLNVATQSTAGGSAQSIIFSKTGTLDNKWYLAKVNVKAKSPYRLVFTGVRGTSYQGDIALDDISLNRGKCPTAQCELTLLYHQAIVSA